MVGQKIRLTIELGVEDLHSLESILSTGVKVVADSDDTRKAFLTSARHNSYDMCKLLFKCGVANVKDEAGMTLLGLNNAAVLGEIELCQFLIEAGSDVNQKTSDGITALMEAAGAGHEEIVRILIEGGSDVNQKDHDGYTALIYAAEEGHEKVVRILIEAGSDVNQEGMYGYTALMWTAGNGHVQISRILLENGADFTAKNSRGETLLDKAKNLSKNEETIELLEYATRLHRSTLFIQSIEYLRKHRQEYEEEEVREYIPDHVMNGFFRNTIWKKKEEREAKRRRK